MKWIRGQGGEGPRARSASGLITHASWWIINISSSRRLVGHAKWNERERERETSRPWEGTAERGSHFHLLSIPIPSRSWIELESMDAWSIVDWRFRETWPQLSRRRASSNAWEQRLSNTVFPICAAPIKGESFPSFEFNRAAIPWHASGDK